MSTLHISIYPMRAQFRPGMDKTKMDYWAVRTVGKTRPRRAWLTKAAAAAEARKAICRAGGTGNIYVHRRDGSVETVIPVLDIRCP